jgi:carboxymethylenebutenolidase
MKLSEDEIRVPSPDGEIRSVVIRPVADGRWPAVLYYSDIFQLTESTLRTARRLASLGFAVFAPEIYPRDLAGVALEFDDAGKAAGLAGAAGTTTAQFDSDRVAMLDHLAARRSTNGWRRRCASTRPACTTGSSAAMRTAGRWPGRPTSPAG